MALCEANPSSHSFISKHEHENFAHIPSVEASTCSTNSLSLFFLFSLAFIRKGRHRWRSMGDHREKFNHTLYLARQQAWFHMEWEYH